MDKTKGSGIDSSISVSEYYRDLNENIRYTDDISFKLMGFVPFISGSAFLATLVIDKAKYGSAIYFFSLLGIALTFFLFRWELRNISRCTALIKTRDGIEEKSAEKLGIKITKPVKPTLFPRLFTKKIGKTEASKGIYLTSAIAWLFLPLAAYFPDIHGNTDGTTYINLLKTIPKIYLFPALLMMGFIFGATRTRTE